MSLNVKFPCFDADIGKSRAKSIESAFSFIAIPKPTASRRSRLQAFRARHEVFG
jgi:hypothetical protein